MGLFSDITSGIFGSGPKQLSSSEIKTADLLSPEQKKLMNQFLIPFLESRDLAGLRDAPAPLGITSHTVDRVPVEGAPLATDKFRVPSIAGFNAPVGATGVTGLGELSLEALEKLVTEGAFSESADIGRESLEEIIGRGDTDFEEFFNTSIRDPLLKDFQDIILPRTARQFGGTQFFSSERQEADARGRDDLTDSLTRARSELGFRTRQQDTENRMGAIAQLAQLERLEPSILNSILQSGEIVRGQDTERLQAERIEAIRGGDADREESLRVQNRQREEDLARLQAEREEALRVGDSERAESLRVQVAQRAEDLALSGAEREEELRQRAERDKVIQQILQTLGIQGQENIAFPAAFSEGKEGALGDIISAYIMTEPSWLGSP